MRLLMTAFVFGIPETKMRVIAPQVGGGFGTKIFLYPEYCLMAALAKKTGRPVKWSGDAARELHRHYSRSRSCHRHRGRREQRWVHHTRLKVKTYANLGGVLSTIAPGIPTTLYGRVLSGAYKIPHIYCNVIGTYTNTGMVDAYRGAGRPEATYVVERAVDLVARELNMDPVEVRRKNFIQPDEFPYTPADNLLAGLKYDSGDYEKALNKALEMVGYESFRKEQEEARKQGRYLGIGFSTYIEICGAAPSSWIGVGPTGQGWGAAMWESANLRVHLTGKVILTIGTQSHGQGHETTMAQIVSEELGIPMEDIIVQLGDTLGTPFGYGTYASRSAAVGGMAVYNSAQKIKEKAKKLAAHLLEASPDDMTFEGGKAFVKGSPDKGKDHSGTGGRGSVGIQSASGHGAIPRRYYLLRSAGMHVSVWHPHLRRRSG